MITKSGFWAGHRPAKKLLPIMQDLDDLLLGTLDLYLEPKCQEGKNLCRLP